MAFNPDDFGETKSGFDPDRFGAPSTQTPSPSDDTPVSTRFDSQIKEAYQSGDPQKAEFLTGLREKARGAVDPNEDVGALERIGQFAGDVAAKTKFEVSRGYEAAKNKITGEELRTETSDYLPDVGGMWKKNPANLENNRYGLSGDLYNAKKGLLPPLNMQSVIDAIELTAGSDEEKVQMYKNQKGVNMFSDEKGNIVLLFDNGYMGMLNKPGLSRADTGGFIKKAGLFALTGGSGGITSQAARGVLAQTGLEAGGFLLGGTFDPGEIVLSGIMDGLGHLGMTAVGKAWSKIPVARRKSIKTWKDLEPHMSSSDFAEIRKAKEAQEGLNAPPLLGEQVQTANKSFRQEEIERVRLAAKDIKDAEKIGKRFYDQDEFAEAEIRDQIEKIPSAPNAAADGAERTAAASDAIFNKFDAARTKEADIRFSEAFKDNNPVNTAVVADDVLRIISDESIPTGEKELVQKKVLKMMSREDEAGNLIPRNSMPPKLAQELKFEIDNLIRKRGETSVGVNAEKSLIRVKERLIDSIEDTNPGYKAANAKFAKDMRSVEELESTLIGLVRGTEESSLQKINNVFNNKDIDQVQKMMGLIAKEDPAAPYALYKGWIRDKFKNITDLGESGNASQDIWRAFFAKPKDAERLFRLAPSPQIKANLQTLRDYLRYSKQVRISGTTPDKGLLQSATKAGEQSQVVGPVAATLRTAGRVIEKRRADAATEAIMNPRWAEDMKHLRGLKKRELGEGFEALLRMISRTANAAAIEADVVAKTQSEISKKEFNIN